MVLGIFRRKPPPPPPRDVAALLKGLTAPAIQLVKADSGESYLGGDTQLPQDRLWPSKKGKPLTLLASLSLAEINAVRRIDWLPESGRLLFFYDTDEQPWGFDPKDRGSWAVMHLPDHQPRGLITSFPQTQPRKAVKFTPIDSIPSYERPDVISLELSDAEADVLGDIQEGQYQGQPQHQIGGHPSPVQDDGMELQSQLVSSGIYCGDESGYKDPRVAELEVGAKDWRLLLQFDSDDELNVMWGDCGKLYFWVREQDAKAGRFNDVWLVLQCA